MGARTARITGVRFRAQLSNPVPLPVRPTAYTPVRLLVTGVFVALREIDADGTQIAPYLLSCNLTILSGRKP